MRNIFLSISITVGLFFGLMGCDRVDCSSQNIMKPDAPAIPIVERSHFYESDQLRVVLPGDIDRVQIMERVADEFGNPDVVLLEVENGGVIHRDPSWFSEGQKIRIFIIEEMHSWGATFLKFYWLSPEYCLSEHIEEFKKLPAPVLLDFEISEYGTPSISFFFERAEESTEFWGVQHKTRVGAGEYVQWAVWSTRSNELTNGKEIWDVSFTHPLPTPEGNVISISAVLLTEFGDYEISSDVMTVPYSVERPFNFVE